MVEALEDSFVSDRIAEAILRFGRDAIPELLETLEERRPRKGPEARWSADRRAIAARLLGEIGDALACPGLDTLLADSDASVRLEGALALLRLGHEPAFGAACAIAIAGLDGDAFQQVRCTKALARTNPWSIPPMVGVLAAKEATITGEVVPIGTRALVALIDLLVQLNPHYS
jgi:hypothetical protein